MCLCHMSEAKIIISNTMNEIADSLSRIMSVPEVYSNMVSYQSTQFTILISVLCGIVIIIVGATWFWNYKGAKIAIKSEVENAMKPVRKLLNTHSAGAKKMVEEEVRKAIEEQNKSFEEKFEQYKKSVDEDNRLSKAELYRIFALHCTSTESYLIGAQWWLGASELYQETNTSEWVGISVNSAVEALSNSVASDTIVEEDKEKLDDIEESINKIPDILIGKKREAKRLLKQLKKKYEESISLDSTTK